MTSTVSALPLSTMAVSRWRSFKTAMLGGKTPKDKLGDSRRHIKGSPPIMNLNWKKLRVMDGTLMSNAHLCLIIKSNWKFI